MSHPVSPTSSRQDLSIEERKLSPRVRGAENPQTSMSGKVLSAEELQNKIYALEDEHDEHLAFRARATADLRRKSIEIDILKSDIESQETLIKELRKKTRVLQRELDSRKPLSDQSVLDATPVQSPKGDSSEKPKPKSDEAAADTGTAIPKPPPEIKQESSAILTQHPALHPFDIEHGDVGEWSREARQKLARAAEKQAADKQDQQLEAWIIDSTDAPEASESSAVDVTTPPLPKASIGTADDAPTVTLPPPSQPATTSNEGAGTLRESSWAEGVGDPEADTKRMDAMIENLLLRYGPLPTMKESAPLPIAPSTSSSLQHVTTTDRLGKGNSDQGRDLSPQAEKKARIEHNWRNPEL
ncbi:MAG: hypothetical protein Q9188_007207 [Gyalolechia gomerana]